MLQVQILNRICAYLHTIMIALCLLTGVVVTHLAISPILLALIQRY